MEEERQKKQPRRQTVQRHLEQRCPQWTLHTLKREAKCGYELDCAGHWFGSEEDELIWILAGRQDVSSSVEGEPDDHEVGKLRRLGKTWNRCYWENRGKQDRGQIEADRGFILYK